MMFVSVDDAIEAAVLERLRATDGMVEVAVVELPR
jgi:hypothetical protein